MFVEDLSRRPDRPIGRVGMRRPLEAKIRAVSGEGGFDNEEESI